MFDFLGKIPDTIMIAVSGNKNSMVLLDYLSRSNRSITMIHVDFSDESSKDRISFLKSVSKFLSIPLIVVKATTGIDYSNGYNRNKEIYNVLIKQDSLVIVANCLEDVIVSYVYNSIKLQHKLISYRTKNILRPYIAISQDEFDYWASNKKVEYIKERYNDNSAYWLIRKHMLDNCYKINPNMKEDIASEVKLEFDNFIQNRRKYDR